MIRVISSYRCGSTIIQLVAHIILYKKVGVIGKIHKDVNPSRFEKVIIPIRDPRDVALSRRRMLALMGDIKNGPIEDLSFLNNKVIIRQLNLLRSLYVKYKDRKNVLIVRYEDVYSEGLGKYNKLCKLLAGFLDVELTDEIMQMVESELNYDKMRGAVEDLGVMESYEEKSYWMRGQHIKSDKVTFWRDEVPPHLLDAFNQKLKPYWKKLGYDSTNSVY